MIFAFAVFLFGLCWGSFLNVVAYRLVHDLSFSVARSQCPSCHQTLHWYDLIPLFSWLSLKGRCRYCAQPISWLYPFIELLTGISALLFWYCIPLHFWLGYGLFASALIVTFRTDSETLTIDRLCTLFILPIAPVCAFFNLIPVSLFESLVGALLGYSILAITRFVAQRTIHHDGVGQGDLELLATIGAFTGPFGCWMSLLIGSCIGSCVGLIQRLVGGNKTAVSYQLLPFGAFLALGAIMVISFSKELYRFFFMV